MKIVSLSDVEQQAVQMEGARDAFKQVPVSREDGSPTVSFRVFTIQPGGYTPYHRHPYEHVNYIIAGKGELVQESGETRELAEGDFALVLPNEKHQYRNTSNTEPMVMICAVPTVFE